MGDNMIDLTLCAYLGSGQPPLSVYQYQMLGDKRSQWHKRDHRNGLWFPQIPEIAGWCHRADGNKSVYTINVGWLRDAANWEHLVWTWSSEETKTHVDRGRAQDHTCTDTVFMQIIFYLHAAMLVSTCKHKHTYFLPDTLVVIWAWTVPVSQTFPDRFSSYVQRSHTAFVVTVQTKVLMVLRDMCRTQGRDVSVDQRGVCPEEVLQEEPDCPVCPGCKSLFPSSLISFILHLVQNAWLSRTCLGILPRMHQSPRGKLWSLAQSVNDSICVCASMYLGPRWPCTKSLHVRDNEVISGNYKLTTSHWLCWIEAIVACAGVFQFCRSDLQEHSFILSFIISDYLLICFSF